MTFLTMTGLDGLSILTILVIVAFFAGFVDAIAGGGGLLTVPALLFAGFDPVSAVATNKLQGTFGVASAAWHYGRSGVLKGEETLPFFFSSAVGGICGALLAGQLPDVVLRALVPVFLVAVALWFAFAKPLESKGERPRLSVLGFAGLAGVPIGVYDGFFGPGAGTFYMVALIALRARSGLAAVGGTKIMNFASNLASLVVFVALGAVHWGVGLAMAAGAAAGARLGAKVAIKQGVGLIKPMIVVVSIAMALRLAFDPRNPLFALLVGQ